MKQLGLGQSNQKELTQKGDEHKEEKQSPRAEQQTQHSKQSGVLSCRSRDLADGELARRLLRRLISGVDGQVVWRPR